MNNWTVGKDSFINTGLDFKSILINRAEQTGQRDTV